MIDTRAISDAYLSAYCGVLASSPIAAHAARLLARVNAFLPDHCAGAVEIGHDGRIVPYGDAISAHIINPSGDWVMIETKTGMLVFRRDLHIRAQVEAQRFDSKSRAPERFISIDGAMDYLEAGCGPEARQVLS